MRHAYKINKEGYYFIYLGPMPAIFFPFLIFSF